MNEQVRLKRFLIVGTRRKQVTERLPSFLRPMATSYASGPSVCTFVLAPDVDFATSIDRREGRFRSLADISDDDIAAVLNREWASAHESTWNRNRAAVNAWLTWCRERQRWPAPAVPGSCERRKEHGDATKDLPKAAIERQLSRRDVPLREKTLWRMLYETAARASEILALDVEQLDLEHRRAPIRSKGGEIECERRPGAPVGVP
jgi:integrase